MDMRKPMTTAEVRLFKQAVIKEYQLKNEKHVKRSGFNDFIDQLRSLIPLNIMLGIISSILLIMLTDWKTLFDLILSGVIWITIISTALSALSKVR